jgi:hypothetical protein
MPAPDPPILDYAAPRLDEGLPPIHTDGRTDLYIRKPGGDLPPRCLICNRPVSTAQTKVKLTYVDPEIRRSYRGGIMFYWMYILVMIVRGIHERSSRQSIRLSYSVCPLHRGNRGLILFLRFALLLACIAALPLSQPLGLPDGAAFIACFAIALNLMIPWPRRMLRIDRLTATHAVLIGPSREFLQSLRNRDG